MKIFDTKKTSTLFVKMLDEMSGATASQFVESVKAKFDEKLQSEEGTFKEYKVTSDDLMELAKVYA